MIRHELVLILSSEIIETVDDDYDDDDDAATLTRINETGNRKKIFGEMHLQSAYAFLSLFLFQVLFLSLLTIFYLYFPIPQSLYL